MNELYVEMVRYLAKNYRYNVDPKKMYRMAEVFLKDPTYSKYSNNNYIIFPSVYIIEYEDIEFLDLDHDNDLIRVFNSSDKYITINDIKYYKWGECAFVAVLIKNCTKLHTINRVKSFAINPFPINGSYEEKYLYRMCKDVILENCPNLIKGNISPYAFGTRCINILEYVEEMDKKQINDKINVLECNVKKIMEKLELNKSQFEEIEIMLEF